MGWNRVDLRAHICSARVVCGITAFWTGVVSAAPGETIKTIKSSDSTVRRTAIVSVLTTPTYYSPNFVGRTLAAASNDPTHEMLLPVVRLFNDTQASHSTRAMAAMTLASLERVFPSASSATADPCAITPDAVQLLGPVTFTRTTGAPKVLQHTFTVPIAAPICIKVTNSGLASARVSLDGAILFTPSSFKPSMISLTAKPALSVGTHTIEVRLASMPSATLTLEIRAVGTAKASLLECIRSERAANVRRACAEAVGVAGMADAVSVLEPLLAGPNKDAALVLFAARSLTRLTGVNRVTADIATAAAQVLVP